MARIVQRQKYFSHDSVRRPVTREQEEDVKMTIDKKLLNLGVSLVVSLLFLPKIVEAQSFEGCPSEAFLIQDNVARLYGVNLATGYYEELSDDLDTSGKINAIGFNYHDNYIYGWGYEFGTLVKVGSDYQAAPLNVSNLPGVSFYVGDVSISENSYFMYRRGSAYGLYKISLDESSSGYLNVQRIIDGASLDLRIYDFAFHPNNGYLYSVDSSGNLVRIDSLSGQGETVGNVGERGTFGAVYFDLNANLYISRNSDGHIFRIDTSEENPIAEFFAFGPASSNNDGARCALADIITEESTVDFGDAPESYGTSIDSNGARHEISEDLYLGESVGGDDDGVNFVTGFETGLDTLVDVETTGEGVLNMWVDWDQSGQFDNDEQVVVDQEVSGGSNPVLVSVPVDAVGGDTWSRTRLSSTDGIGPTGGVSDGEVEDNLLTVTPSGVSIISYPGSDSFVTLAFEDNWPLLGDYDFNDVVMAYRTKRYIDENQRVVRYDIEGHILGMAAGFHNGFAVQLDGIRTDNVIQNLVRYEINGESQTGSPVENNEESEDMVVVVFDDLKTTVQAQNSLCDSNPSANGCTNSDQVSFFVSVPLSESVAVEDAPHSTLNPFIFAPDGFYHGDIFPTPPGRSLEIHLKNKKVSSRFQDERFGSYDDNSDSLGGTSFLSLNNMPWAIEIPILWDQPLEGIDITDAYPEFPGFVESEGQENSTWYLRSRAVTDRIMNN